MKRATRLRPAQGGKLFGPVAGLTPIDPEQPKRCDCANPDCALPVGRCFLCKNPVDNDRTFAVCADCDDAHQVRSAWTADYGNEEARNDPNPDRECFCPGWLWMNEDSDASFNIERCDTCAVFRDDLEAAGAMVARCRIRSVEWP